MIVKVFLAVAIVAVTFTHISGAPASTESAEDKHHPQPYEFGYLTNDNKGTTTFRKETSDGKGKVEGTYGYKDLHGIERVVEYVADEHGYRAEIKTNEPGTESQNPADVILHAHPIQIEEEPKQSYGTPAKYYNAPEYHYGAAPANKYDAPAHQYEAPELHYDAPAYHYEAPVYHYDDPTYHYDAQSRPSRLEEHKKAQAAPAPQQESPEPVSEEEPKEKYSTPAYLKYYKPIQVEQKKPKLSEDVAQPAEEEEPKTKYSSTSEEYEYQSETKYTAKDQQDAPKPYYRHY